MKKALSALVVILSFQGSSFAKDCDLYKKVLLPEVVSYCLVAEGIITVKEAFMMDEYHLLTEKEKEQAAKQIHPTTRDVKEFIASNGYCQQIASKWKEKSYSVWCPIKDEGPGR